MALTPSVTPLRQPPAEDLRNAAAIANAAAQLGGSRKDFARITELIGRAFEKLAEPPQIAIERVQAFNELQQRDARDVAAVVITAALEWK